MTHRERAMAVLHYRDYDRLPVVHFGFWRTTDGVLYKWARQGHITLEEAQSWRDGNPTDVALTRRLGFDFNWYTVFRPNTGLLPPLKTGVLETLPDGSQKVLDGSGAIVLHKEGAGSIPMAFDHLLKGRKEWEETFKPRLQFTQERLDNALVRIKDHQVPFSDGGREYLQESSWQEPYGLHCGSLYGIIRNWLGLEGSAYLLADDEKLFDEIIDTVGTLCYDATRATLESGARFDFGEDISFKNGPLVNPEIFREKVGPHYRRITDLLGRYGTDIVSLDSDGKVDDLVPIWLENGVNTMFPIEVGTWHASIAPWRERYGRALRGVGGMDKRVFAEDFAAVDREIERLKPLVELGGYIPCPDHRIAPDAEWDNVRYYCDRMHRVFGG